MTRTVFVLILSLSFASSVTGKEPGIAREVLDNASKELKQQIADKKIAGGAHLVVRNGERVYFEVAGVSDIDDKTPLKPDAIMRIYSMSKPITSVAAMKLWEQGKFKLDDPVAKHIPSFKATKVLAKDGDQFKLVDPERPITVRDVFRHTTGYTYGRGTPPQFFEHYKREGMLYDAVHGMFPPDKSIAEAADCLARIPTAHQPGARFTYGFNTDLLGRLIEVWSGKKLDDYLQSDLFEPLEMTDTGFQVPKAKRARFVSCHTWKNGKQVIADKADTSPFLGGFEFLSGGGGLVSTMDDYASFCQMLVDGGECKGGRILKAATLDLMFTNQLKGDGLRFGLGFAIRDIKLGSGDEEREGTAYAWGGYANTAFQVVPEEKMFQVFMRQSIPSNHRVANKLFPIVYQGVAK